MKKIRSLPKKVLRFVKTHKIISAIILLFLLGMLFVMRPKAPKLIPTETVIKKDFVRSLSITGTVTANNDANLSFQTGGMLAFLGVHKGDIVQQYQTIATLDQRTVEKNLKTTLIAYSKQRNTFDQYNVDQQADKPQDALNDRMKRLLQNNQYDLDAAINSVELQDLVKQNSVLWTPIAGVVTRADVKTSGVNITPSTTWTVTDPTSLEFKMEVDEADISKVHSDLAVDVNLNSYPDSTLHLVIDSIDFVTHTTSTGGNAYDVKAKMPDNSDFRYLVGMNGNAEIILSKKRGVLSVPLSSLFETNKVYVKVNKKYEKRTLKLGAQNDTSVEVLNGLKEGDVIVTDPTTVPVKK